METQKTGSGMRKLLIQAVIIMGGLTVYARGTFYFAG